MKGKDSKIKKPHASHMVRGISFSPTNPDQFYSFGDDCSIKIWSFKDKTELHQLSDPTYSAPITSFSFSYAETPYLLSIHGDSMTVWKDSATGWHQPHSRSSTGKQIEKVGFCDGDKITTLFNDGTINIFKRSDEVDSTGESSDHSKNIRNSQR